MAVKRPDNYIELVHEITCLIPKGRVSTYGAIADYLALGSARMVGFALKRCELFQGRVPAFRVVNSKGELSGRNSFPYPTYMQEQLEAEGTAVKNDKVVDFKTKYWHPRELNES